MDSVTQRGTYHHLSIRITVEAICGITDSLIGLDVLENAVFRDEILHEL